MQLSAYLYQFYVIFQKLVVFSLEKDWGFKFIYFCFKAFLVLKRLIIIAFRNIEIGFILP